MFFRYPCFSESSPREAAPIESSSSRFLLICAYSRSTSARRHSSVPGVITAAVPAATPNANEARTVRPCARPNVIAARKLSPAPTALLTGTSKPSTRVSPSRSASKAPSRPSVSAMIPAASEAINSTRVDSCAARFESSRPVRCSSSPRLGVKRRIPRPIASRRPSPDVSRTNFAFFRAAILATCA